MTDHRRFPPTGPDAAPPRRGKRASLIERAGGSDDWRRLVAPPVDAPPAEPVAVAPVAEAGVPVSFAAPAFDTAALPAARDFGAVASAPRFDGLPAGQTFRGTFHLIDRKHLREQGLIEPEGPVTALLEEFRIIKRQLLLTAADSQAGRAARHGERILVCSALPGEGKTFCSVNLALSLAAEKDTEVLLVDADFAKPSVLSTLGLPGGPGLLDALADPRVAVEDCILGTDIPGLFVLPAGNASGADTELLASARTVQVLDRLTANTRGRIVIFDSSPVLAASPASALALHVGQAVVVVRADMTSEAALRDAVGLLSGCEDIKLLLNAAHFSPSGRRFGTYYGYKE
ncbi:AAA family ATPase [Novosphingobium sp. FSW06-99]|uniref:AAA family ATPase n=1 Tax=Novosphingobium sp. FSW06-99 TaxID=1739113 RepID=UPI00076CDB49|nr:AAA family ATPase [Novosphingobium sp. FSW06-99]KUR77655.1 capsular biosynthesis protein [Novosphingobium sp. FSW06-99]